MSRDVRLRDRVAGLALLVGVLLSALPIVSSTALLAAQEPPAREQAPPLTPDQAPPPARDPNPATPSFGREVEVVRVDVVVTDKSGKPFMGLTKDDFSLLDEGKIQTLESFEKIALDVPPAMAAGAAVRPRVATNEAPPPTSDPSRSVVIIFDDLDLTQVSAPRAKAAVAAFLDMGVREGDRVSLIATGGGAWWSTRMQAGRSDLLSILKNLQGRRVKSDMRDTITDFEAMRIYLYQDTQVGYRVMRRFETYGVKSRVESSQERERRQTNMPGVNDPYVERRATEEYLKIRSRNRVVFGTLERAIRPLTVTRERKTILLVSDGFVFDTQEEGFRKVTEAARRANAVLYFLDTRGLEAPSFYSAQFDAMPADPGEFGAVLSDSSQDAEGSDFLARETGGFSVRNTNDLTLGAERIAQEARSYYLIGYSPNVPRDGRYRKLEVKVRGKGLTVRARRGYYAPSDAPVAETKPSGKDVEFQEALDSAVFRGDIPLRMTSFVLGDGAAVGGDAAAAKAAVLVAVEADVAKLDYREEQGQLRGALDFLLVVARRETGEFSRYDQRLDLARKPGPPPSGGAFYPVLREFELASGGYQAKVVVRDPATRKVGSLAFEFEVPPLGQLRVSTPVLTDTVQQGSAGPGPVPVARRTFPSSLPLYCRFDVYGAGRDKAGQPRVLAGHELRRTDGTVVGRSEPNLIVPTSLGAVARLMQIPLNVGAGDYELVLKVRDEVAGASVELVEPFRVEDTR